MYEAIGIQKLSENQLRKLLKGEPVRIKIGAHHKIHLSIHQLKKLHSAHKKGKASTITFDPYQRDKHGEGIFGDIAKHLRGVAQKHKHLVNPIIRSVKGVAHQGVHKLSKYAHDKIDNIKEFEGHGLGREFGDMALSKTTGLYHPIYNSNGYMPGTGRGIKRHTKKGKGLLGAALNGGGDLANIIGGPGSGEANQVLKGIGTFANMFGLGIKHKKPKTTKGKGFLTDLAKKGLKAVAPDIIDKGAEFAKKTVNGMGAKRRVGRPRKHHHSHHTGGALFPGGM